MGCDKGKNNSKNIPNKREEIMIDKSMVSMQGKHDLNGTKKGLDCQLGLAKYTRVVI